MQTFTNKLTNENRKSPSSGSRREKVSTFFKPCLQSKLTIGCDNESYEREANIAADRVMEMSDRETSQIKLSPEAGANSFGSTATPLVHDVINSSGKSLDTGTKKFMEARFGYDFSHVQIHNDSLAQSSASSINALAYTYGNHIVFGPGEYQPATGSGKKLLAHEMTHIIQQGRDNQIKGTILCQKAIPSLKGKTDLELKRYAVWPDEAFSDWKTLSPDEQSKVITWMTSRYGADFVKRFLYFTTTKKPKECILYTTNVLTESHKNLEARGYKLVDVFMGGTERWVNSNCNLLYRILPSGKTPAGSQKDSKTAAQNKPAEQQVTGLPDSIDNKNPEAGHGEIIRSVKDPAMFNWKGKAVEFADGTIILYSENSIAKSVLLPVPDSDYEFGGAINYRWYNVDSDADSTVVIWSMDPDELF